MAPNKKSVFPLSLVLLLLLAMIILNLNIPTEAQAKSLAGFNPQSTSRPNLPANQSSDDDDDKNDNGDDGGGGENDNGDGGDENDNGDDDSGEAGDSGDEGEDEDTSQSNPSDSEPTDDGGDEDTSQPSPSDSEPVDDGGNENAPQPSPSNNEPADDDDDDSSDASTPQFVTSSPIFSNSGPATIRGVVPVFYPGNPQGGNPNSNCGFFNTNYREFRISKLDIVGGGNYNDGFLSLDIVVTLSPTDGPSFSWSIAADSLVKAMPGIFVKGGDNGNWYNYSGFTDVSDVDGAAYDGGMHSPVNPTNGKFYGLSHVSFCYFAPTGGNIGRGAGGGAGANLDTSRSEGTFGGDGTSVNGTTNIFGAWVPAGAAVDEVSGDNAPAYLPNTGIEQIWDYSFIVAALLIGGLSLAVVSLHSYLLFTHPNLYDHREEDKTDTEAIR